MEIERDTVVEAGASLLAVGVFIAAVVAVGVIYRTNGHLSSTGGLAVLGAIVLFVVVMTGIGYWFAGRE